MVTQNIAASEYLLWAYRLLLGREPEDMAAVQRHAGETRREIVARFLRSQEFRAVQAIPEPLVEGENFWFIAELADGIRFWVCAEDRHVSRGVALGRYEPVETAFIQRHVKQAMNVLDIGANIGWYTVLMSRLVGPSGHVDAFEPRNEVVHYLRRTIAENGLTNVDVHHCALGASDGAGTIAFDNINFGATHLTGSGQAAGAYTEGVAIRRLDSVISRDIDFVKIDVEGAEKLVFDGAGRLLQRDRPLILCEINNVCLTRTSKISSIELKRYFGSIGYELRTVLSDGCCGAPVGEPELLAAAAEVLNVACVPTEKAAVIVAA